MRQSKQRTITTIVGVMLSTMLLYIVFACGYSAFHALKLVEYQNSMGWDASFICDTEQAEEIISLAPYYNQNPAVDDSDFPVSHAFMGCVSYGYAFFSINDFNAMPVPFSVKYGTLPKSYREVLLGSSVMNYYRCSVGDSIQGFNIIHGELEELKVSGIMENAYHLDSNIGNEEWFETDAYILMDDEIFRAAGEQGYLKVFVTFKDKENITGQTKALANAFGVEKYKVNNKALACFAKNNDSLSYLFFEAMLMVVAAVCAVAVMFIVRNAFNISVHERQNDYGVLRCIGMSRRQIIGVILCETAMVSSVGVLLGILLGHGLSVLGFMYVRTYFLMSEFFRVHLYAKALIYTIVYAVITSCYAMVAPIEKLYKINPIEALRHSSELKRGKPKAKRGRVLGKLFGVEMGYAYKNVMRRKSRFIISVVSLSLVTTVFVGLSTCMETADGWSREFYKLSNYDGEFAVKDYAEAKKIMSDLKQLDVTKAMTVRLDFGGQMDDADEYNADEYRDTIDRYLGLDSEAFGLVLDKADIQEKLEGKNVLNVICIKGTKRGDTILHAGDRFEVQSGDERVTVYLYGEIAEKEFEKINARYRSRDSLSSSEYDFVYELDDGFDGFDWCESGYSRMYMVDMHLLIKLSTQQTTKKFDTYLTEVPYYYDNYFDIEQDIADKLEIIRFIAGMVLVLFLAIFVTNVVNVNRSEMLLRKRELQMMRIVGMSYKQESRMLYSESVIAGVLSFIIGSAAGMLAAARAMYLMRELVVIPFLPAELITTSIKPRYALVPSWISIVISFAILLVISLISVFLSRDEN